MIKIGVLGAGHLGKIHIRLLKQIPDFELIGFFDPNKEATQKVQEEFGIKAFSSPEELMAECESIDIVAPTIAHHELAVKALKKSKSVFIEKPISNTMEEAKEIIELAAGLNLKVQIGHVERFNPAFLSVKEYFNNPMFIETHRLAQFNPRGTDVSVVLDLMIHDIDIVLSVVKSKIKNIYASGVAVVSDSPDIANARIEFENGAVANITASRISLKNMRKSRFFQKDAYIAVDFLEKKTEVVRIKSLDKEPDDPFAITIDLAEKGLKQIFFDNPKIENINAIKTELESFAYSIKNDQPTVVTDKDGYIALDVAFNIMKKMELSVSI
jgi:predicted dehydrogenase